MNPVPDDDKADKEPVAVAFGDGDENPTHNMADAEKKSEKKKVKQIKKNKYSKDPNAPKRPLPAFFKFSSDERNRVKQTNIHYNSVELGRKWCEAEPEIKSKYLELAKEEKARYVAELAEYKKTLFQVSEPPVVKTPPVLNEEEQEEDK